MADICEISLCHIEWYPEESWLPAVIQAILDILEMLMYYEPAKEPSAILKVQEVRRLPAQGAQLVLCSRASVVRVLHCTGRPLAHYICPVTRVC